MKTKNRINSTIKKIRLLKIKMSNLLLTIILAFFPILLSRSRRKRCWICHPAKTERINWNVAGIIHPISKTIGHRKPRLNRLPAKFPPSCRPVKPTVPELIVYRSESTVSIPFFIYSRTCHMHGQKKCGKRVNKITQRARMKY